MAEFPRVLGSPERECQEPMTEQFFRCLGSLVTFQIFRARHEQVSILQQSYGNERRVMQLFVDSKREINPFDDLIHDAFGDENLNSHVGVNCLESHDDRSHQSLVGRME